jgi:regulator of sirC expression with transglutaminase-like and TPR domain
MNLNAALSLLADTPDAPLDLAELALELARDEYPEIDIEAYLNEIAAMALEARNYVRGDLESRVGGLCRYLFHEMGFRGNNSDYYNPQNSYFNCVLDGRKGIPITLSALAMAIGARTDLRIEGVGLPGHFVVKAVDNGHEVIFDPFHGGRVLSPENCESLVALVTGTQFQATPKALTRLPLAFVVQRMLNNLKSIYLESKDFSRAIRVIERLRQINPSDPSQERDLGVSLLRAGHTGKAVDYLSAYLDTTPAPTDAAAVREVLRQAREELAKWN